MASTTGVQATVIPEGKALPPKLDAALDALTEIATLPEVTTRIVEVVEDPRASARDMHDIVRTDPALAAKILKVVNSAFYGLPSQIASLDRAILMLGLSAVKNIALAASLSRLFRAEGLSQQFAARDLWRHSVAVGVCARLVGQAVKSAQSDEGFVAGLVHDLGLIVERQLFGDKISEVVERCSAAPQDFCAVEREVLGADHQAFGHGLALRWKFPPGLRHAIAYHHEPLATDPEFQRVVALIYVADVLCGNCGFGFSLTTQQQSIEPDVCALLELSEVTLVEITDQLPAQVTEAEQIFME